MSPFLHILRPRRMRLPKPEGAPKLIAVDARFLGAGSSGLAEYSENLLLALSRLDPHHQYTVFVNHRLTRKLKLGENFTLVPMRGRPLGLPAMLRFSRALRREDFDLVHVHFPLNPLLADIPTLLTVHDMMPFARDHGDFGQRMRPWRMLWTYLLYPLSIQHAQYIVCVSAATRRALTELFPAAFHKSVVVHSALKESFRAPMEAATLELIRKRLALPPRYVLYAGSARPDKNLPGVIRVFARMLQNHERFADMHLTLALNGDDPTGEIERLVKQFNLTERVRILRNPGDEERQVCFHHAQALMLLARGEGFGFPVLEAQASGVPVLAARAGALPEIAGREGAALVDPGNEHAVLEQLIRILEDKDVRSKLIERGRDNVERFSWDAAAKTILQMYDLLFV